MHMTHANVALRGLSVRQDWSNVKQIVEFGGGTGDMCAATLDMGFQGTYFVYVRARLLLRQRAHYDAILRELRAVAGHGADERAADVLVAVRRARSVPD
jgi:hypothetical protein